MKLQRFQPFIGLAVLMIFVMMTVFAPLASPIFAQNTSDSNTSATATSTTSNDAQPAPAATTSSSTESAQAVDNKEDNEDEKADSDKAAPVKKGLFGPKKLPYCKPGQDPGKGKVKVCRIKLPKMTPVNITDGTLTVNGMIAKVGLNYQIADLKYLYFWVPGLGIVTVTDKPFPGAKEQLAAFHSKGLTVKLNDQIIELYSDNFLLKNDKKPLSAWVALDPTLTTPVDDPHFRSPVFGWGVTPGAPYTWPGSMPTDPKKHALAPPVPVNLRPVIVKPVPVTISSALPAKTTSTTSAPAAPATGSDAPAK